MPPVPGGPIRGVSFLLSCCFFFLPLQMLELPPPTPGAVVDPHRPQAHAERARVEGSWPNISKDSTVQDPVDGARIQLREGARCSSHAVLLVLTPRICVQRHTCGAVGASRLGRCDSHARCRTLCCTHNGDVCTHRCLSVFACVYALPELVPARWLRSCGRRRRQLAGSVVQAPHRGAIQRHERVPKGSCGCCVMHMCGRKELGSRWRATSCMRGGECLLTPCGPLNWLSHCHTCACVRSSTLPTRSIGAT